MENTLYVALSRQMALRREMDIIANNMANMTTTAFKGEKPLFQEYLMGTGESPAIDPTSNGQIAFVEDYGVLRNTAPGTMEQTGNPTDLALQGDGFLVIQTPDGERYTRNGHFTVDPNGRLVTREGLQVLGQTGQGITLPRDAGPPVIAPDGTISAGGQVIGQLRIVEFANLQDLRKEGDSLFSSLPGNDPTPAAKTTVEQGMMEGSNVQPVIEMTRMIEVSRSYQQIQALLSAQQDLQTSAIEKLAKVQ
jgi:flagellar basal-body rod protein FlgF